MHTNEWVMYCHKNTKGDTPYYKHFCLHIDMVKLYGSGDIVKVHLKEDATGTYWGWLRSGHSTPTMIWHDIGLLRMCFPYSLESEEKSGASRRVCLILTELEG